MPDNNKSVAGSRSRRRVLTQLGAAGSLALAGCTGDGGGGGDGGDGNGGSTPTATESGGGGSTPTEEQTPTATEGSDFPSDSFTVIPPYSPGGGSADYFYAQQPALKEVFGQNFQVRFRPGSAAMIGISEAVSADPDGYTWGQWIIPSNTISWYDQGEPFDPTGIKWVGGFGVGMHALVASSRHEDLRGDPEGFTERARNEGVGKPVNCVRSRGLAVQSEYIRHNDLQDQHPPSDIVDAYDCTGDINNALVGAEGHWTSVLPSGSTIDFSEQGDLVPIGWWGESNLGDMWPDVPAMAEDTPDLVNDLIVTAATSSRAYFCPPETPDERMEILRTEYEKVVTDPEVDERAPRPVVYTPPDEFQSRWEQAMEFGPTLADMMAED